MAVGVSHQLIGFLACGIQAHGMIDRLTLLKRQIAIASVDGTAGGINQISDAVVAAALKDMPKADQIALDISGRVLKRVSDARLSGKVHHHLGPLFCEQGVERLTVFQIQSENCLEGSL